MDLSAANNPVNIVTIGAFATVALTASFGVIYFLLKENRKERSESAEKIESIAKQATEAVRTNSVIMQGVQNAQEKSLAATQGLSQTLESMSDQLKSSSASQEAYVKLLLQALDLRRENQKP